MSEDVKIPVNLPGTIELKADMGVVRLHLEIGGVMTTLGLAPIEAIRLGRALVQAGADAAYVAPEPPKKGGSK